MGVLETPNPSVPDLGICLPGDPCGARIGGRIDQVNTPLPLTHVSAPSPCTT